MGEHKGLEYGEALDIAADVSEGSWALLGAGQLAGGDCLVADVTDAGRVRAVGYFQAATGDVFACEEDGAGWDEAIRKAVAAEPAVHVIGSLQGNAGQVTVRQPAGNYLRICRWDRLAPAIAESAGACLRTLPQCGCGGSLGSPKLFDSFRDMSVYHFCAFYL